MMFLNHCFISIIALGDNSGMWPISGSASLLQVFLIVSEYCSNRLVIWGMTGLRTDGYYASRFISYIQAVLKKVLLF